MKLLLVTTAIGSTFKFNYHSASGQKKVREINVDDFVLVKGWKSIGNKVDDKLRMSSFKFIENKIDENELDDINKNVNE